MNIVVDDPHACTVSGNWRIDNKLRHLGDREVAVDDEVGWEVDSAVDNLVVHSFCMQQWMVGGG